MQLSVVCVGGGTGLSDIAPFFARKGYEVTCIVGMWDSGGSTGVLRTKLHLPAMGDIRKVSSALSGHAFFEEVANGHKVGNVALAYYMTHYGTEQGCAAYAALTGSRVLPVTHSMCDIAFTAGGKRYVGEHLLDAPPKRIAAYDVTALTLTPVPPLAPAARDALLSADILMLGPGSLLGSLLPHLSAAGFVEAWQASSAKKYLVLPAVREYGYRQDTYADMRKRFAAVTFDAVLTPRASCWTPRALFSRITA